MKEISEILKRIKSKDSVITENFDIFELKLRSYLNEIKAMYPIGETEVVSSSPSLIISDLNARKLWEQSFGKHTHGVSYAQFLEMLQSANLIPSGNKRFLLFLEYFVNFPSDDYVTTYQWDSLIRLFGPFPTFSLTFSEIIAGRGFLGLVNRIKAYEILTMVHQPNCLLIRLSRTEPEFLAFSYKNADGQILHQINKDRKTGLPIPISKFIKSKFSGFTLVNKSVDVEQILGTMNEPKLSLFQYASAKSEYILSSSTEVVL